MIEKINTIQKLAVFRDFDWDSSVRRKDGSIESFNKVNVIYGRNYSGKTTLSRLIRSYETGCISDKYDSDKQYELIIGGKSLDNTNLTNHNYAIRVFNEDFVRENLSFPYSNDGVIKSFAVLGENNNAIQSEIDKIQNELGSHNEGEESTGLYKDLELKNNEYRKALNDYNTASNELNNLLSKKASGDRSASIKYQPSKFGDQNYTISKLHNDIKTVLDDIYQDINDDAVSQLLETVMVMPKQKVTQWSLLSVNYNDIINETQKLVETNIVKRETIEELISNDLIKWAKQGKHLHSEGAKCALCGNIITHNRWDKLSAFFDESQEKLENSINQQIRQIENLIQNIKGHYLFDKTSFYTNFHTRIDELGIATIREQFIKTLEDLIHQLKEKQDNLFEQRSFLKPNNYVDQWCEIITNYNKIVTENNGFTEKLDSEKSNAQKVLRLHEVFVFINTIGYLDKVSSIQALEDKKNGEEMKLNELQRYINGKEDEIVELKSRMNDEQKAAIRIKELLQNFFGHQELTLSAEKDPTETASYRFSILRNDIPAYNLSEGECNIIAFCYFMAKLEDISTSGKHPIIWIDDPISSLDSNHIFSIFSLIQNNIVRNDQYEQLFISTHNLNFLKYLKRLVPKNGGTTFFVVVRNGNSSQIERMPNYMKEYVTEFNYLFKQIYECANIAKVDDTNFTVFYNFGNNARKFLEIFLYYKYPDMYNETKDENAQRERRRKFFGDGIEPIFTNRLINEYSHLCGTFERGESIVDVPEMQKVAQAILKKIEEKDKEQYDALVNSIK